MPIPDPSTLLVAAFAVLVPLALALDLGVFHRSAHVVAPREALAWTAVWIGLAAAFGIAVAVVRGEAAGIAFATGYVIEYSLSIDNVFVFTLVFAAFAVPRELQHRVLFWGVIGALVMRLVMVVAGTALIERFGWILLVFGGFLVITGVRMLLARTDHAPDPSRNAIVRWTRRHLRVTDRYEGQRFLVRTAAGVAVTPLFLALVAVEATDLLFAVDSVPAIFAVTTDPFIVYTSNAFAIMGLRSLYFLLAEAAARFAYLRVGLAAVLVFVGGKLLLADVVHVAPLVSLGVVAGLLGVSVAASLLRRADDPGKPAARPGGEALALDEP